MTEAILAVTPSETIKYGSLLFFTCLCSALIHLTIRTKLIDDAKRPNPQFRGLVHGTSCIIKQEGIFGIYRGLFPVVSYFSPYRNYGIRSIHGVKLLDDASRCQLGRTIHDLYNPQAVRAGKCTSWATHTK